MKTSWLNAVNLLQFSSPSYLFSLCFQRHTRHISALLLSWSSYRLTVQARLWLSALLCAVALRSVLREHAMKRINPLNSLLRAIKLVVLHLSFCLERHGIADGSYLGVLLRDIPALWCKHYWCSRCLCALAWFDGCAHTLSLSLLFSSLFLTHFFLSSSFLS